MDVTQRPRAIRFQDEPAEEAAVEEKPAPAEIVAPQTPLQAAMLRLAAEKMAAAAKSAEPEPESEEVTYPSPNQ